MAYVLEEISDEDYVNWSMEDIEKKYFIRRGGKKNWVVNRDTDSFLIKVKVGRFDDHGKVRWLFKWRKKYIVLVTQDVDEKFSGKDF